jgi:hypothetical protein
LQIVREREEIEAVKKAKESSAIDKTPLLQDAGDKHDKALQLRTQGDPSTAEVVGQQSVEYARRLVDAGTN